MHACRSTLEDPTLQLDTTDILFICGGAFPGLDDIVRKRLTRRGDLGFRREERVADLTPERLLHEVLADDLLEYGLIPEFVGRLPVTVAVDPLDQDMLVRILTEPRNALVRQYRELFSMDGVELQFTDDALRASAGEALKTRAGARGLRTILERTLLDVMFEIPSRQDIAKCVVRAESIRGESPPLLITRSDAKAAVREPRRKAARGSESA